MPGGHHRIMKMTNTPPPSDGRGSMQVGAGHANLTWFEVGVQTIRFPPHPRPLPPGEREIRRYSLTKVYGYPQRPKYGIEKE